MRRVAILSPAWFDFDGKEMHHGGAERYLLELCRLMREMGYHVEVFQAAHRDWLQTHEGFAIHGLSPVVVLDDTWPRTNQRFQEAAKGFDYHLYFTWAMAYPQARPGSLGVSHSLWWDDRLRPRRRTTQWAAKLRQALQLVSHIVANDTNIINWVRATYPELEDRFGFIPNFVDTQRFVPPQVPVDPSRFIVLFPRRLEPQKGLPQALEAAKGLTAQLSDIAFHFVGRGPAAEEGRLRQLSAANGGIRYEWRLPDEMPAAYQSTHLVLLPTTAVEGTSLSCLEAMACGCPVIASPVGGLCNLIIHEYNGLLVSPTVENLTEAILRLKGDLSLRERFASRSREVAAVHSLQRWRARWAAVLNRYFP